MPGALMQLVAYGAQDVYLTGNPQMTFWKAVYKRHTNFAIESIEQVFNGQGDFGSYVQCVVGRNGDLIHSTYLVVTLPEIDCCWSQPPCDAITCWVDEDAQGDAVWKSEKAAAAAAVVAKRWAWAAGPRGKDANWARWIDYPGENLIEYAEVEIGGTVIDKQYGEWMHIWNQLTLTNEKREGYHKMIGHTTELTYLTMGQAPPMSKCSCCKQLCEGCNGPCNTCAFRCNLPETTLYIPLLFWFCRNPGLALPLIALQYHEVKINIQLRNLDCLLWAVDSLSDGGIAGKAEQLALRLGLLLEVISCDGDNESLDDLLGGDTPDAPDPGSPGDKVFAQMEQLWSNPCGTLQQATAGASKTITLDYYNGQAAQGSVAHTAARSNTDGAYNKHLVTCSLFIDYIFLDRDERRYMAQNPHQYLIEQVQFNDTVSTAISENTVELDFNHPCKEIFLTTQQEYFRDCCKQFEACEPLYKALGIQPFNYTDCLDAMTRANHAFHGPDPESAEILKGLYLPELCWTSWNPEDGDHARAEPTTDFVGVGRFGSHIMHKGLFRNPGAGGTITSEKWDTLTYANGWIGDEVTINKTTGDLVGYDASGSYAPLSSYYNSTLSDAGAIVLAKSALNMHCWGKNPIYRMVLQLNGQDRFSERAGKWFDLVQPFKYHTHLPDTGINLYSFALKPEDHNPSGTLNFSRIDNANLRLTLSNFMFNANNDGVAIKVYATNYNILRIMSGMGGLAYSN